MTMTACSFALVLRVAMACAIPSNDQQRFTYGTSGGCCIISACIFADLHFISESAAGGAVYIHYVVFNATIDDSHFRNCSARSSSSSSGSGTSGGACYLRSSHFSMSRSCGTSCFSYEGQFLYLSHSSPISDSARTLSLCSFFDRGPSWTEELAFEGGISINFVNFASSAVNFTECYCYYHGAAWQFWDELPSAVLSFLTVLRCVGASAGMSYCLETFPTVLSSNFFNNSASDAALYSTDVGMNVSHCLFFGAGTQIMLMTGTKKFIVNSCTFSGALPSAVITGTENRANLVASTIDVPGFGAAECSGSGPAPSSALLGTAVLPLSSFLPVTESVRQRSSQFETSLSHISTNRFMFSLCWNSSRSSAMSARFRGTAPAFSQELFPSSMFGFRRIGRAPSERHRRFLGTLPCVALSCRISCFAQCVAQLGTIPSFSTITHFRAFCSIFGLAGIICPFRHRTSVAPSFAIAHIHDGRLRAVIARRPLTAPLRLRAGGRPECAEPLTLSEAGDRAESGSVGLIVGLVTGAVVLAILGFVLILVLRRRTREYFSSTCEDERRPSEMVSSFLTTDHSFLTSLNEMTVDAVGDSAIRVNAQDEVLDNRAGVQS
jgi:hypothetical protein